MHSRLLALKYATICNMLLAIYFLQIIKYYFADNKKKRKYLINSYKPLYRCTRIECIVGRLYNNFHVKIQYTYTQFFHMFLKVVWVSCYQIV